MSTINEITPFLAEDGAGSASGDYPENLSAGNDAFLVVGNYHESDSLTVTLGGVVATRDGTCVNGNERGAIYRARITTGGSKAWSVVSDGTSYFRISGWERTDLAASPVDQVPTPTTTTSPTPASISSGILSQADEYIVMMAVNGQTNDPSEWSTPAGFDDTPLDVQDWSNACSVYCGTTEVSSTASVTATMGSPGAQNYGSACMVTYRIAASGPDHEFTAGGAESSAETGSAAITVNHAFACSGAEAGSETGASSLTVNHALTAGGAESAAETGSAALSVSLGFVAGGAESATEIGGAAFVQDHSLVAGSAESTAETGAAALTQHHVFTAAGAESAAETGGASLSSGVDHAFEATGAESSTETGSASFLQSHSYQATGSESASETGGAGFLQDHAFTAGGAEAATETGSAELAASDTYSFTAGGAEAASETGGATIALAHLFTAQGAEALTETGGATVTQNHGFTALGAEAFSETGGTAITSPVADPTVDIRPGVAYLHSAAPTAVLRAPRGRAILSD